jgi:peptidoglycan/LPS O-acetylase OafA/YrhL
MSNRARYGIAALVATGMAAVSYWMALNIVSVYWTGLKALTGMVAFGVVAGICVMTATAASIEPVVTSAVSRIWSTGLTVVRWLLALEIRKGAKPTEATWAILAGCRMFLASIVVATHLQPFYNLPANSIASKINSLNAEDAVICFLLVSGFSIAHSAGSRPDQYYARRFWRIVPVYVAVMLISFLPFAVNRHHLVVAPIGGLHHNLPGFYDSLKVIPTFGLLGYVATNGVVWSLGVEVFWYALAPLLIRFKPASLVVLLASAYCFANGWPSTHLPSGIIGANLILTSWAWLAGFAFYTYKDRMVGLALPFVPVYLLTHDGQKHWDLGPHLCAVFAVVLVVAQVIPSMPKPASKAMNIAGDISYPLYLVHTPVNWLIYFGIGLIGTLPTVAVIFAAATVIYLAVDLPFRKIAKKVMTPNTLSSATPAILAGSEAPASLVS